MVTITADTLTTLVNDTTITHASAESIIDQAIDEINSALIMHNASELTNLSGTAGSKTGTYTSAERGCIIAVAMELYQYYKTSGTSSQSWNVSGMGASSTAATGGNVGRVREVAKAMAQRLIEMEVNVG